MAGLILTKYDDLVAEAHGLKGFQTPAASPTALQIEALIDATLAQAEQARIANLIAYLAATEPPADWQRNPASLKIASRIEVLVREGLGV